MKNSYFKLSLELYKEGESFNIYISDNNGGSSIVISGKSPEETANNTIPYIIDYMEELKNRTIILSELSTHKIQDILENLGMIDENGKCPYTAEEIFRAGLEYSIGRNIIESQ